MPRPKVSDADFIDFLIATPRQATATEAQRTQPPPSDPRVSAAAHDAYTRLLHRLEPDAHVLWEEVRADVRLGSGMLVLDADRDPLGPAVPSDAVHSGVDVQTAHRSRHHPRE